MQQFSLATADIAKLVSLHGISREHGFHSHWKFSRDMLGTLCEDIVKAPTKMDYFTECDEKRLHRLLFLSQSDHSLRCTLPKIWIIRLRKTGESIFCALEIAEVLELRNFMAELYYLELARIAPVPLKNSTAYDDPVNHLHLSLDRDQKEVLFRGCFSLQLYWRHTLKKISHKSFECANRRTHGCRRVWKNAYERSLDLVPATFDPLQELRDFEKDMAKLAKDDRAHVFGCALKSIKGMITQLESSLADHFFGPR
jgi:hypothetical protein